MTIRPAQSQFNRHMTETVHNIQTLLDNSAACAGFKNAIAGLQHGRRSELIIFPRYVPAVKALRVCMKFLEAEPTMEIRNVRIEGITGCRDFSGALGANDDEIKYAFSWDCRWRAQQTGMLTTSGTPDQARAAREFGYQCFRRFERMP